MSEHHLAMVADALRAYLEERFEGTSTDPQVPTRTIRRRFGRGKQFEFRAVDWTLPTAEIAKTVGCSRELVRAERRRRRAAGLPWRQNCTAGCLGMAPERVAMLYADYRRLGSLRKCAKLHGVTNQSLHSVFKSRGLQMKTGPKAKKEAVWWNGELWSPDKNGYLRSTTFAARQFGKHRLLHRVKWEELRGPIPKDYVVAFKDFDPANCDIDNLVCVSRIVHRQMMGDAGRNRNAFSKFYEEEGRVRAELQAAIRSGDDERITKASEALKAVQKPDYWTKRRRDEFCAKMRKRWAQRTPAQRRAIRQKGVNTRRANERARLLAAIDSTDIERGLAA